jgi:hypothetical protein
MLLPERGNSLNPEAAGTGGAHVGQGYSHGCDRGVGGDMACRHLVGTHRQSDALLVQIGIRRQIGFGRLYRPHGIAYLRARQATKCASELALIAGLF